MNASEVLLSTMTGVLVGALFQAMDVPIPAPPNMAGIMGIVGVYLGYKIVEYFGWSFGDLLQALGV